MQSEEATEHVTISLLILGVIVLLGQGYLTDFKQWLQRKVTRRES